MKDGEKCKDDITRKNTKRYAENEKQRLNDGCSGKGSRFMRVEKVQTAELANNRVGRDMRETAAAETLDCLFLK